MPQIPFLTTTKHPMSKKIFPLFLLVFSSIFVFAQKTDVDKAYNEACTCIVGLDKQKLDPEAKKAKGMECMQNVMMKHIEALAKDNGYELNELNDETARLIGEKFGQTLVSKCPGSISFFMEISKGEIEKNGVPLTAQYTDSGSTAGTFVRLETTGDSPKIILKLEDGSEESFLWLRPFTGSDTFESQYKTMINKKVTVEWGEFRKYVFSMKGYAKVREVTSLK